jgi:hypothetical protein
MGKMPALRLEPTKPSSACPRHSACKGARDDFGNARHAGIGILPGRHQSPSRCVGRISPSLRSPNRDEQNRRHHLGQAVRLRMLEDYAAMHARDKGVGDAVLVTPSAGEGRTNGRRGESLTRAFGIDAPYEARQRQREAESAEAAQEWRAVALAIARKTGSRLGLDTATRRRWTRTSRPRDKGAARLRTPSPERRRYTDSPTHMM